MSRAGLFKKYELEIALLFVALTVLGPAIYMAKLGLKLHGGV